MAGPAPHVLKLSDIASRLGLQRNGTLDPEISGVGTLSNATGSQISFLANSRYRSQLASCSAAAVILRESDAPSASQPCLIAKDPYLTYARVAAFFDFQADVSAGVHPSAIIEPGAKIDPSACIGPLCVIADSAIVEAGAQIGPGCVIGPDCRIGTHARLLARVTLVKRVSLGPRVLIHSGAVLGADGFGLARDRDHWIKVPQLGGVRIGADCEIGANSTIDCGAIEDTILAEDVRIDNQVQIAHNVKIGAHTAIAGCAALAGSCEIGSNCLIGGGAGIVGHISVCDHVVVGAYTLVTHSITEPGEYASGTPVQPKAKWLKNAVRFGQLDQLTRKINLLIKESE